MRFYRLEVVISVDRHFLQQAIDFFKQWSERATRDYAEQIRVERGREEAQLRAKLQQEADQLDQFCPCCQSLRTLRSSMDVL